MKKISARGMLLVMVAGLSLITAVAAQTRSAGGNDKVPVAVLSTDSGTATIETTVDAESVAGGPLMFRLYQKTGKVSRRIAGDDNVRDCLAPVPVEVACKRTNTRGGSVTLVYRFATPPAADSTFEAFLETTDRTNGNHGQILKVLTAEGKANALAKKSKVDVSQTTRDRVQVKIRSPLAYEAEVSEEDRRLLISRFAAIYKWFRDGNAVPKDNAVWIELRKPKLPKPDTVKGQKTAEEETISGALEPVSEPMPQKYTVKKVWLFPDRHNPADGTLDVIIETDEKLPTEKYDLAIAFPEGSPAEIVDIRKSMPGTTSMVAPDASKVDTKLGLRDFKSNFDLGISYTSSVDNVKVGNRTVRERQNNGTFDIVFAPWINRPYHQERFFWTPFFVDAKISTGEVSKKTLSTNRILFGTRLVINARPRDSDDVYLFSFAAVNASDRDFKRAEATLNFEFRPLFAFLNKPLERKTRYFESILIKSQEPKEVSTGWFGYQIQPFISAEVGRVYHKEQNAVDSLILSSNVRRLTFGMDLTLNLTSHANLTVLNKLYYRGEVKVAQTRNYFNVELRAPFFTSGSTSQCLFFAFEKGDQPPFATPTVNVFKAGYRITSNFFRGRR